MLRCETIIHARCALFCVRLTKGEHETRPDDDQRRLSKDRKSVYRSLAQDRKMVQLEIPLMMLDGQLFGVIMKLCEQFAKSSEVR